MTYQYEPTPAEKRAATLLRNKGWHVAEPACPDCGGLGFIGRSEWSKEVGGIVHGSMWNDPCPRGCTGVVVLLHRNIRHRYLDDHRMSPVL